MSQVVIAERKPGSASGQVIVERIREVVSIDAVMFPATTCNLREQTDSKFRCMTGSLEQFLVELDQQLADHLAEQLQVPSSDIQRIALFREQMLVKVHRADADGFYTLSWQLQNDQPLRFQFESDLQPDSISDLIETNWPADQPAIHNCFLTEALPEQTQQLLAEIDQLRSKRDALLAQLTESQADLSLQQEIDTLLSETQLPAYAVSELFREQLRQAKSTELRKSLIAERSRLLFDRRQQPPVSQLRTRSDQPVHSDEAIISAIKKQTPSVLARSA